MATGDMARLMESHVIQARRALESGVTMTEALAALWQAAYAAGVGESTGLRQAPRAPRPGRLPADGAAAVALGWRWGSAAFHEVTAAGTRFTYGGCDPARPNCARPAISLGTRRDRPWMQLEDTGEECPATVMFWGQRAAEVSGDPSGGG